MKRKKLLSVLVAAALSCSLFSAITIVPQAADYTSGDWSYTLDKEGYKYGYTLYDGCAITAYGGLDKNVVIPSTLDGNTVKVICDEVFEHNKDITSVTIPNTVESIDGGAFSGCTGLIEAKLGNNVKYHSTVWVPENLFENCSSLEKVTIPEGIMEIGGNAFGNCSSLIEIRLPDTVKSISYQAFRGCTSLKDFYDYNDNTSYYGVSEVFKDVPSLTIHGYPDSNAEAYAKEHGIAFAALTKEEMAERGKKMYRLYNPNSGEHFYTKDEKEKADLVTEGWKYEGIGWIAPEKTNTPVYRLYNENAGDHHYTLDSKEKDSLITAGWKSEGIGWYSDDDKTVPLYREYNPNAVTGTHNYTTDKAEHDSLVTAGWNDEGIGWYGITIPDSKYVPGEIIIMGSYEQDNDLSNGKEPIEWVVLGEREGKTLLLSQYALDNKQYYKEWAEITWEDCILRTWLNNDFYETAFSAYDKQRIVTAHNENPDSYELYESWSNPERDWFAGTDGGNATDDRVFLLSWEDARDYLDGKLTKDTVFKKIEPEDYNQKLICRPTPYAIAQGLWTYPNSDNEFPSDTAGCCEWWLRSPGSSQYQATVGAYCGALSVNSVHNPGGVRPAILID